MWRPGEEAPTGEDVASLLFPSQHKKLPITKQRQMLPIFAHRDSLLYALETHRTVLLLVLLIYYFLFFFSVVFIITKPACGGVGHIGCYCG